MKYPPGTVLLDTMAAVQESIRPVSQHGSWVTDTKLRSHAAVAALMRGEGNRGHATIVIETFNMSRSLVLCGFGVDLTKVILDAQDAIKAFVARFQSIQRYTLTAQEINALRALLELHDAQLEVATVGDIDRALDLAKREFRGGKSTRLSTKPIGALPPEQQQDSGR